MSEKIYVISATSGGYEPTEWISCAFKEKDKAELHCKIMRCCFDMRYYEGGKHFVDEFKYDPGFPEGGTREYIMWYIEEIELR